MKTAVTAIMALVIVTTVLPLASEAESSLNCTVPATVVVPLVKGDARWPKEPWRFGCFPEQIEVSVVSLQSRADLSLWTAVTAPLRASVIDAGPLRLALTGICSGSNGETGVLEGNLKWGGFAVGLRNCSLGQFQALRLRIRVEK